MFLNVFSRIKICENWKKTRLTLIKTKDGVYKLDMPIAPASEGRPELGNKKSKPAKAMGTLGEQLQASINACIANARAHVEERQLKDGAGWKLHFQKQNVKIELLKTTATVTKRNTDLQFLLGGNTVNMDDAMKAWYM
jgi:hypothetical protein